MTNQEFIESISLKGEIWKDVVGYEGIYLISNMGRVFSAKSRKILSPTKNNKGYLFVKLGRKNKQYIHRLVYGAFIGYSSDKMITNHKNSKKDDNRLENLESCDYSYNSAYAYSNGERELKPVTQFSLDGEYIHTYKNALEAYNKTNISKSCICSCCKGKIPSAGGYLWAYKGQIPKEYKPYSSNQVKVLQYNLDGTFVRTWDSLTEAEVITHKANICKCCRGLYKSAGGYIWRYTSFDYETLTNMSKNALSNTNT